MFGKQREKDKKREQERVTFAEYYAAKEELKALKKQYGIADEEEKVQIKPKKEGLISRRISAFFERQESREPVAVSKKKYIWAAVLTGWIGGHRFYCKHYRVGLFYLLFFWMGMGVYHTIIDLMAAIPMQPDENGYIYL